MAQSQLQRYETSKRYTDDVGTLHAQCLHSPSRIVREIGDGIGVADCIAIADIPVIERDRSDQILLTGYTNRSV